MGVLMLVAAIASTVSLGAWVYLMAFRGQFWRTDLTLPDASEMAEWPSVSVVVPARNEAGILPRSLPTLLRQDYPGLFRIFLVDDRSDDGTGDVALQLAAENEANERLSVIAGEPLPAGWAGKVWAMEQGVRASEVSDSDRFDRCRYKYRSVPTRVGEHPDASGLATRFLLLTDADIAHPPDSLRKLVSKAMDERLDLVSLMARLHVVSFWERLLIPAFVYFFAKLYPFRWSNEPRKGTAAAAGGCILLRREVLERVGGIKSIASALIDDCALAGRVKRQGGRTWIGLTQDVRSIRPYDGLADVWRMVARSAFAQLRFSSILLAGTVLGMLLLYLVPPLAMIGGAVGVALDASASSPDSLHSYGIFDVWLAAAGLATWALMSASYVPMLRWHDASPLYAPTLPLAGVLYTLMTVDSALRWFRGKGGAWKGRTYGAAI